jgi:hypothetical protein
VYETGELIWVLITLHIDTRYEAVRYAHAVAVKHLAGVFESDRRPGLEILAA